MDGLFTDSSLAGGKKGCIDLAIGRDIPDGMYVAASFGLHLMT
jgi:hypothetical protein